MGTEVLNENGSAKPSELEEKIIRQIEYYFGNYNLSRDKFLKQEIKNDDGWVPLETLIRFNRLKQLTEDFQVISDALKKSANQLMEVNEDSTKIRRKVPVPEKIDKDELEERSLYVKGFKKDTQLDEILDFFREHNVENVLMRKKKLGSKFVFKGSVFATFETKEAAEEFLNKSGLKFQNADMLKEKKKDYIKRKDVFYDNLRLEKEKKLAEKREEEEKLYVKGSLLKVTGLSGDLTREDLKEAFEKFGTVIYVDYSKGKENAIIRFEEGIASDVIKSADEEDGEKKLEVGSIKAAVALIEGDEETKYFQLIIKNKAEYKKKFDQQRGSKRDNRGRFKNQRFGKGRDRNRDNKGRDDANTKEDATEAKEKAEIKENDSADTKKTGNTEEDGPAAKKMKVESNQETKSAEESKTDATEKGESMDSTSEA